MDELKDFDAEEAAEQVAAEYAEHLDVRRLAYDIEKLSRTHCRQWNDALRYRVEQLEAELATRPPLPTVVELPDRYQYVMDNVLSGFGTFPSDKKRHLATWIAQELARHGIALRPAETGDFGEVA